MAIPKSYVLKRNNIIMNLRSIIRTSRDYNFHTHTHFCDGRASMADMAEAACIAGIRYLGFSPHAPVCVDSPCNMATGRVEEYLDECNRLRAIYAGRMEIYAGMEIDFIDESCSPASDWFRNLPLDFRIGSVHFVPTREGRFVDCDGRPARFAERLRDDFDGDLWYVVRTYFRQVRRMIELGGFDIVGHIDKIARNADAVSPGIERTPEFRSLVSEVLLAASRAGLMLEVNTKELEQGSRLFPSEDWFDTIASLSIPVIVNSDAHYPDRICSGREATFRKLAMHNIRI